jgi:hypothetical protein
MKQQNLYLPTGYTINHLRQMPVTELTAICDSQHLCVDSVRQYLEVAKSIPPIATKQPNTRIHPDFEFLRYIRTGTLPEVSSQPQLASFTRKPERIKAAAEEAMDLLDKTDFEQLDWAEQRQYYDYLQRLFHESLLQLGLKIFDEEQAKLSSNPGKSVRESIRQMSEYYRAFDNVYPRRYGYAAALAIFGHNVDSVNEMQAELNFILIMYEAGKATIEDKIKVNKLLRAVKGVYFRGATTVDAGTFAALVPALARKYHATRPKTRLHPGTVLGAEVYDVGVYAGENYEKTKRPRRYGDGLGRN